MSFFKKEGPTEKGLVPFITKASTDYASLSQEAIEHSTNDSTGINTLSLEIKTPDDTALDSNDFADSMSASAKSFLYSAFCFEQMLFGTAASVVFSVFPAIAADFGFTSSQITLFLSGNGLGGLLAGVTNEYIPKLISRRKAWFLFNFCQGFFFFLFALLFYFPRIHQDQPLCIFLSFCLLFIVGLTRSYAFNLMVGMTAQIFKNQVASKLSFMITVLSIGIVLGPLLSAFLIQKIGLGLFFAIFLLGYVLNGSISMGCFPQIQSPKRNKSPMRAWEILRTPRIFFGYFNLVFGQVFARVELMGTAIYAKSAFDLGVSGVSLYIEASSIGMFLLGLGSSYILKVVDHRLIHLVVGLFLMGLGGILLGFLNDNFYLSVVYFSLMQVGITGLIPTVTADVLLVLRERHGEVSLETREKVAAISALCTSASWFIGPLLSSLITQLASYKEGVGGLGLICVLLGVPYYFFSGLWRAKTLIKKPTPAKNEMTS